MCGQRSNKKRPAFEGLNWFSRARACGGENRFVAIWNLHFFSFIVTVWNEFVIAWTCPSVMSCRVAFDIRRSSCLPCRNLSTDKAPPRS